MDQSNNVRDTATATPRRTTKRRDSFKSSPTFASTSDQMDQKPRAYEQSEHSLSTKAKTAMANGFDHLDDTITRGTEGTSSFSTLGSSTSAEDASFKLQSPQGRTSEMSTSSDISEQQQQQFSSRSIDLRVSRAQARRARRNGGRGSATTTGSTSISPTPSKPQSMPKSIRTEGGAVMLAPDLEIEDDVGNQRVGDDLVGANVISRARDSSATAHSRDSAMDQPPPEYRIDDPEKEERASLPPNEENRPGAFAIPRRAFGGVPAWFEEAVQRRQQNVQRGLTRMGSSARSLGNSSRRLSLQSFRESSLRVIARLHDSKSSWNDEEGTTEFTLPNKSGDLASSVLDASCRMDVEVKQQNNCLNEEDDAETKVSRDSTLRGSMPEVLSKATKPLVKMVKTPIQLFRKKPKPVVERSNSLD